MVKALKSKLSGNTAHKVSLELHAKYKRVDFLLKQMIEIRSESPLTRDKNVQAQMKMTCHAKYQDNKTLYE